ncbi:MAG: caspase family protein [Muribaculaceae bacterium]|nr:caspase family protein [Muribaculaceae bacterium]
MKHSFAKTILSLFTLLLSFPLSAQNLYPFVEGNKYGFKDENGKTVIPAQFDEVWDFSGSLAKVQINGKYLQIDKRGRRYYKNNPLPVIITTEPIDALIKFDGRDVGYSPATIPDVTQGSHYVEIIGLDSRETISLPSQEILVSADQAVFHYNISKVQTTNESSKIEKSGKVTNYKQAPSKQATKNKHNVDYADKMVDVDAGIPAGNGENYGTYAVVIGNEEYLDVAPVANAANDGRVMREYLVKTLGVPESNIIYFENASSAVMDRALSVLEKKANAAAAVGKKFNVIFYYSGHGVPSDDTQEAYLLPVDVSPSNLKKYGLPLSDVYRRLGALNAQCVTVFLDACFSGAGRDNRMLAEVKGVQLEPKKSAPTGNMVVLSACSGRETANIFKEGKHGLFTYWLLRKLKETKGNVTLGELQEHLQKYVDYTATNRLNLESGQKPTVQTSPTLSTDWRTIRLR